jgi:hypothetical protein
MRPWTERIYGIPPDQVIGSRAKMKYALRDGKPVLMRLGDIDFIDDGPGKPIGLWQQIGRLERGLDEAPKRGWVVVDMKRDRKRIFAFQ